MLPAIWKPYISKAMTTFPLNTRYGLFIAYYDIWYIDIAYCGLAYCGLAYCGLHVAKTLTNLPLTDPETP